MPLAVLQQPSDDILARVGKELLKDAYADVHSEALREFEATQTIQELISDPSLTPKQRRLILHKTQAKLFKEKANAEKSIGKIVEKEKYLSKQISCWEELLEWLKGEMKFSPGQNLYHDFLASLPSVFQSDRDAALKNDNLYEAHCFVVTRLYADVLEGAPEGEFRLPYPVCAFQFTFDGRPVIIVGSEEDDRIDFFSVAKVKDTWALLELKDDEAGTLEKCMRDEIRALCIVLETEIAEETIIRAPHRLNAARVRRNRLPINDYSTIDLRQRHRYEAMGSDERRSSPRLHFRRGHWRHYSGFKSWVRWTVAGDPSKGILFSEYRV
jgi:hypothetical protein